MKVLVISDVHSAFRPLEEILRIAGEIGISFSFACGDITHFRSADIFKFERLINEFGFQCVAVHGNCDPPETLEFFEETEIMLIHGKSVRFGEFTLHGLGGSNFTPFFTQSEYSEDEMRDFTRNFRYGEKNVLISHCPPRGILDRTYSNVHAGCMVVREILDNFDAVLCGHIHEARGKHESPLVLNPGNVNSGYFAILDLESFSVELKRV